MLGVEGDNWSKAVGRSLLVVGGWRPGEDRCLEKGGARAKVLFESLPDPSHVLSGDLSGELDDDMVRDGFGFA